MKKIIRLITVIAFALLSTGCIIDISSLEDSGDYRRVICYNYTGYDIYMIQRGSSVYSYSAEGFDILYTPIIYNNSYGYTDYNYYGGEYFHAYDSWYNWIGSTYVGSNSYSVSFI